MSGGREPVKFPWVDDRLTRILGSRRSGSGDLSDECLETKEANKTLDQENAVMSSGRTYYSVILARPAMSYNLAMFCTYLRIDFELHEIYAPN